MTMGLMSRCAITVALVLTGWHTYAAADLNARYRLNVPPLPVFEALKEFAAQTNLQVVYYSEVAQGIDSPGAVGQLTAGDALGKILSGTGLTFQFLNQRTIAIRVAGTAGQRQSDTTQTPSAPQSLNNSQTPSPGTAKQGGWFDRFRLAQAESPTSASSSAASAAEEKNARSSDDDAVDLGEVVVTGSRIRSSNPASQIIEISKVEIERSGYATVGEVITTLPQNFAGGVNPTNVGQPNNFGGLSSWSPNLRGLGVDSTLTLIDGHRFSYSGVANSVDVSVVPLAAVERIEVLTDGASSIYGSDAVAGVVNVILRRDYAGAETTAQVGAATRGGAGEQRYSQVFGGNWASGNAMLAYEYYWNEGLDGDERDFSDAAFDPTSLFPRQKKNTVWASGRQDINDRTQLALQGFFTKRSAESASAFSPAAHSLSFVDVEQTGVAGSLRYDLSANWRVSVDGTYSKENDALDSPTIFGAFIFPSHTDFENDLTSVEVGLDGPVVSLPGGNLQMAAGAGIREESFTQTGTTDADRKVEYAFVELRLPVVRKSESRRGLIGLEFVASGRHEHYSDFGDATTPKLGILYRPFSDVTMRLSWGRAFRASSLLQEFGQTQVSVVNATAFGYPTAGPLAMAVNGSNTDLEPEESQFWTINLEYVPAWLPSLRLSSTAYRMDYTDRIVRPITSLATAFTNPAYIPLISFSPSAAFQQSLIDSATLFSNFSGQPYVPENVVAVVFNDFRNVAKQEIDGIDLMADYHVTTAVGDLDFSASAAWLDIHQRLTSTAPELEITGRIYAPANLRARAGAAWSRNGWTAAGYLNFVDTMQDNATPALPIDSWTTLDVSAGYKSPSETGFWSGTKISLSVRNAFDSDPPTISPTSTGTLGLGFDSTNSSPLGRFASLTLQKEW